MGHRIGDTIHINGSEEDGFNPVLYSSSSVDDGILIEDRDGSVYLSLTCFEDIRDHLVKVGAILPYGR